MTKKRPGPTPVAMASGLGVSDHADALIGPSNITPETARHYLEEALFRGLPDGSQIAALCFEHIEAALRRDARFKNLSALERDLPLADARRDVELNLEELNSETLESIVRDFRYQLEE